MDQIHKIHDILGTPHPSVLERFQKLATHMEFDFSAQRGRGIDNLLPNVSRDAVDLIYQLLIYDPNERINAEQALQHPWFRDLYELENPLLNDSLTNIKLSPQN